MAAALLAADVTEPGSVRRPDPRRGPLLWIQLAWGAMLVAFALGVPIYQAPDEALHVDRVLDAAGRAGFQNFDENTTGEAVARSMQIMRFDPRPAPFDQSDPPTDPVPSFHDLGGELSGTATNQLSQHPPTYYALIGATRTATVSMLPEQLWRFDRDVLLMRLLNVLLVLPLPTLCAIAAANLRWNASRQWIGALVPLGVPQLAHIGASVNNDNLVILAGAAAMALAAKLLVDGLDRRTALLFAGAVGLALLTKFTAIVLLPLVVVVCWRTVRRRAAPRWLIAAMIGIITASSWFYVRSLVLFGDPVATPPMLQRRDDVALDPLLFAWNFVERLAMSFWARFGVLWVDLPAVWVVLLTLAVVGSVGLALVRPGRVGLRWMMVPLVLSVVTLSANALRAHLRSGLFPGIQGRYLFVVFVGVALAVVRGSELISATVGRRVVLGVVAGNFLVSAVLIGRSFWGGTGVFDRLGSVAAWSPLGQAGVVVLVAAIVGVCVCLALSERAAMHGGSRGPQKGPV